MIERLLAAQRALAEDRLDQAERLFRGVAAADARNAIAVTGLGEVALARGDPETAAALARHALDLDREDVAAARLLRAATAAASATRAASESARPAAPAAVRRAPPSGSRGVPPIRAAGPGGRPRPHGGLRALIRALLRRRG